MNSGMNDMILDKNDVQTKAMDELCVIPVQELIPQRAPFLMIDKLKEFDSYRTTTEFTVKEDNIFFEDKSLSAVGLIENIAQTCAARMGYINRISGEPVKLGLIGAVRNMMVKRTPIANEKLNTTITIMEEIFNMTLVHARIESKGELLAEAEMKIALSGINAN